MIFSRYLIKLFLGRLLTAQLFILVIYTSFLIFQHMEYIKEYDINILQIFIYDVMKTPYSTYQTIPIAVIAGTMFTILTLVKNQEILAYVSLGGRIRNIAFIFLGTGLGVAFLLFLIGEYVNPKIEYNREKYEVENIKGGIYNPINKLSDLWLKEADNRFINVAVVDPVDKIMLNVVEYHYNDNGSIYKIVSFERGAYENSRWVLENYKEFDTNNIPKLVSETDKKVIKSETFDNIVSIIKTDPKLLSVKELDRIIGVYESKGLNSDKYKMLFYNKFSHPLSIVVLIILIVPLSISFSRHGSYITLAARAMFAGFGFWLFVASGASLGKAGVLSPFFANFLPHSVFAILAIVLFYQKEKGGD